MNKLYHFYAKHYGNNEYFVMSDSLENAKLKVKKLLLEKQSKNNNWITENYIEDVLSRVKTLNINEVSEVVITGPAVAG